MKWFDNPRKRRKKRKAPKGGWKKYMAKLRAMRGGKKKRRSTRSTGGHMARRKRRGSKRRNAPRRRSHRRARARSTVIVRSNPRRHIRRYRRRHNPGFSARGIMGRVTQGAVDGIWVVGGKAVTNALPSLIGLSPTGALGLGVKALAAVAAGYVFGMISPNAGKLATASGFASIYEPFIVGLNLPLISPALADDDYGYAAYPEVAGVSSYPESGVGDEDELAAYPQY